MSPTIVITLSSLAIALLLAYAVLCLYRIAEFAIFKKKFEEKLALLFSRGEAAQEEQTMFKIEEKEEDHYQKLLSNLNYNFYVHIKNLIYFVEIADKLTVKTFVILSLLCPMLVFLAFNNFLPQLNVFSIFAIIAPYIYLLILRDQKIRVFVSFFPSALESMASNLKAGADIIRAIQAVAEDEDNFFAKDFKIILSEIELGVPIQEAFQNYSKKINIPEVELFSMGITLSMESGANLATFFTKISDMIRRRIELKGKINIATSESRFSMLIMILTPIVVAGAYTYIDPDRYISFLQSPIGQMIIYGSAVMMTIAVVWVHLMMKIEE